jgi:hypothetical protein
LLTLLVFPGGSVFNLWLPHQSNLHFKRRQKRRRVGNIGSKVSGRRQMSGCRSMNHSSNAENKVQQNDGHFLPSGIKRKTTWKTDAKSSFLMEKKKHEMAKVR